MGKYTHKSLRLVTDNLHKRQVTPYYFPLLALILQRENRSVVTAVSGSKITSTRGLSYRLELTILGYAVALWWHRTYAKPEVIDLQPSGSDAKSRKAKAQ